MKVYVVRHGESETNLSKNWTGWLDVHLTEKGRDDAKKAGEYLSCLSFDKIYSSDLDRAMKTAETALPGCIYETTPLLREVDLGTLAGKPLSFMTDEQRARVAKQGYVEFDGESKADFCERISRMMKELEKLKCESVALFSHAGWLRGMLDAVIGTYLPRKNIYCGNCAIAVFEFTNGIWRLHSWINLT